MATRAFLKKLRRRYRLGEFRVKAKKPRKRKKATLPYPDAEQDTTDLGVEKRRKNRRFLKKHPPLHPFGL
jgi:hypothetical protein